jgi:hypothetical protein
LQSPAKGVFLCYERQIVKQAQHTQYLNKMTKCYRRVALLNLVQGGAGNACPFADGLHRKPSTKAGVFEPLPKGRQLVLGGRIHVLSLLCHNGYYNEQIALPLSSILTVIGMTGKMSMHMLPSLKIKRSINKKKARISASPLYIGQHVNQTPSKEP